MATLLYLDDMRDPAYNLMHPFDGDIVWVKSYAEFESWIKKNGLPTKISFDFSLNDNSYDGISCAKSVIRYCYANSLPFPRYAIHSEHPDVYKLREYIAFEIEMRMDCEVVEEDRLPDTEDQANVNRRRKIMDIGGHEGMVRFDSVRLSDISPLFPHKGTTIRNTKVSRNDRCVCGSGLKYKNCCLKIK